MNVKYANNTKYANKQIILVTLSMLIIQIVIVILVVIVYNSTYLGGTICLTMLV